MDATQATKVIHGDHLRNRITGQTVRVVTHWNAWSTGELLSFIVTDGPDNCSELFVSQLNDWDHLEVNDTPTVVRTEIVARILIPANDESMVGECACTTYAVAEGKSSQLIGTIELLTLHRCGWEANHTLAYMD